MLGKKRQAWQIPSVNHLDPPDRIRLENLHELFRRALNRRSHPNWDSGPDERELFDRLPKMAAEPLFRVLELATAMVETECWNKRELDALCAAAERLEPQRLLALIDVASRLAEDERNPCLVLELATAAAPIMNPAQFDACLELVGRLSLHTPRAIPPVVVGGLTPVEGAITRDVLMEGLEAALKLAESDVDPSDFLRTLPNLARVLSPRQLRATLDLATELIPRGISADDLMPGATGAAESRLSWQQLVVAATHARSNPAEWIQAGLIKYGWPIAAQCSSTVDDFRANLQAIGASAEGLSRTDLARLLKSIGGLPPQIHRPDQLLKALRLQAYLSAIPGVDSEEVFGVVVRAAVNSAKTPVEIADNLEALSQTSPRVFASQHLEALRKLEGLKIDAGLFRKGLRCAAALVEIVGVRLTDFFENLAVIGQLSGSPEEIDEVLELCREFAARRGAARWTLPTGLSLRQLSHGIETARLLLGARADPSAFLLFGLPLAASLTTEFADYQRLLQILHRFLAQPRTVRLDDTIQALRNSRDEAELLQRLQTIEKLAAKLAEADFPPSGAPGLLTLAGDAIALSEHYHGFDVVHHPEVSHTETYEEWEDDYDYYGSSSGTTVTRTRKVVDLPSRWEVVPVGFRSTPRPQSESGRERMVALLEKRSWLWRSHGHEAARRRAVERSDQVRAIMPALLEFLVEHGQLGVDRQVISVYLIGSYPWRDRPDDVDLLIVVEGAHEPLYLNPEQRPGFLPDFSLGAPLSVEIVGHVTMLAGYNRGLVGPMDRVGLRYCLLGTGCLLTGADLHRNVQIPTERLQQLAADLRRDLQTPPEEKATRRSEARRRWRQLEVDALESFLAGR